MEASPMSLFEKFIKESYGSQYVIPVYQRNYTWKKNKQVKQLVYDIERILKGETERHFLGTIVYIIVNTDFIVRERAVVDGQQRLITMFLIAYALRNIAKSKGNIELADIITSSYLENANNDKYKYRLQPSVSDDDAYSYITADKISEFSGHSLIMDSYNYLYKVLGEMAEEYTLEKVINAVRKLYIVRIELDNTDNAQQIFESINSKGEQLNPADLIRNYVMMNRQNDEQEKIYSDYWGKLENIFPESKKMTEFFRFYLAAKTYILSSEKELYEVFKQFWRDNAGETEYLRILQDLLNYAKHFETIYLQNGDDYNGVLTDFRKLQSLMPAPFVMRILELKRVNKLTSTQVEEIFRILNTYLVRRYITGLNTNAISKFFPGYLKNVENQVKNEGNYNKFVDICKYYLINENKGKAAFMPDDTQIYTYLQTANAYALSNIRWVLDKIETYKNPVSIILDDLNIEHIMPQKINSYWKNITGLDEDEYTNVVNRLGNLTLAAVGDNSKMSNNDFDYKKSILQETKHLKMNEKILQKDCWTVEDIDNRTKELTDKFIQIFPYIKTDYDVSRQDKNRHISLRAKGISAEGYLNEDNSLVVYAGSQIKYNVLPTSETLQDKREDFIEQEILEFKDSGVQFTQNYTFNSPSTATDFILGGSNNGWLYWKDNNGVYINESLRKQKKEI